MNKEEIEELKEFTIDLNDIDDLALGLEICSKKSNMVIQEFIDTIVQLQQENQSLKKENKILRENAEHNDKVVDKVNWENQKLKEQVDYLRRSIERKEEIIRDAQNEIIPYTHEYVTKLINRQNNFIEWLESYLKLFDNKDIYEEGYYDCIEEILSKYREIIGSDSK